MMGREDVVLSVVNVKRMLQRMRGSKVGMRYRRMKEPFRS